MNHAWLPNRQSVRLPAYDYSRPGIYYVTIVINQRKCALGAVGATPCGCPVKTNHDTNCNESIEYILSFAGRLIEKRWCAIPEMFANVRLDEFIIMPNHFHGLIEITESDDRIEDTGQPHGVAPTAVRINSQNKSISNIVHWFKTKSTNDYIMAVHSGDAEPFDGRLWQRNYYERIIRNENELNRTRQYIKNNPTNWQDDENNPKA